MLVGEDVLEFSSWLIFSLMESLSPMEKIAPFDEDALLIFFDDFLLGQVNDPCFYNLEDDNNAFSSSICFAFFCRLGLLLGFQLSPS